MAITVLVGGLSYAIHVNTIQTSRRLNQAATVSFQVEESVASSIGQKQTVVITETARGVLFSGFIDTIQLIPHTTTTRSHNVTCIDKNYLAQKWYHTKPEFVNRMAGDIVSELHLNYLAQEGITANYAMRHDYEAVGLGQGTLSNTTAASGDLELPSSGSTVAIKEAVSSDWNAGTLNNTQVVGNALTLDSQPAIKFTASANAAQRDTNLWTYRKIWQGAVTVADNDIFTYDMFISSSSPAYAAGMDVDFSDGTYLRDKTNMAASPSPFRDQYGLLEHPNTDTSAYSLDKWYHREIILPQNSGITGMSIASCSIALEGDATGDYTSYFKNAQLLDVNRTVKVNFFTTSLSINVQRTLTGYYNSVASVVNAYYETGTRLSPLYSLGAVGIVKNTIISWLATLATQPTTTKGTPNPQVLIEATVDGGVTWDACTNHKPLNFLLATMNTSGKSLQFRQTLAVGGPSPELSPVLTTCVASVQPSYSTSKTDVWDTDYDSGSFAGTLSNTTYKNGALQMNNFIRNYDQTPIVSDQLSYGGAQLIRMDTGSLYIECTQSTDVRTVLNWAGNWTDFTAECDVLCPAVGTGDIGICYGTTVWNNSNNTYAYCASIEYNHAFIARGGNGTSSFTQISSTNYGLSPGTWYHMKLVKSGSLHTLYVDDILLCQVTDSTYSGNNALIAIRHYNANTSARNGAMINHIGISPNNFTGTYTSNSVSLSSVGTVERSYITWEQVDAANTVTLVETQVDGSTWQACTNGGPIPNLPYGKSVSSANIRHRVTYTVYSSNVTPRISGLTLVVIGKYSASGTRVSPVLSINAVGRIGSSSITWIESTPPNATTFVDTSPDNSVWTQVTNGQTVPGVTSSPLPTTDDYTVNSAGNYTSTYMSGGSAATYVDDTVNTELDITSGNKALYTWNILSMTDGVVDCIGRQSEDSGILARYTNALNFYSVIVNDASSGTNANKIILNKTVAGVVTQLGIASISFTRLTNHAIRLSLLNSVLVASFDGVALINVTDNSLGSSGKTGFYSGSGHSAKYSMLRIQPQEDDATGRNLYTRVRFTSTNSQLSPKITDIALSVRGLTLASGALIPLTQYSYTKKVGDCIADVAKKSNCWSAIDDNGVLTMLDKHTRLAPFPLSTANGDILLTPVPNVTQSSPKYRNRQYIDGATDVITVTELCPGDGFSQSWPLKFPIQSVTSISTDTLSQSVGIAGVDIGKNFYYTVGNHVLSQELTAIPLSSDQITTVVYQGIVPYVAVNNNVAAQTALHLLDGSTGIVEESESLVGGNKAQADQLAAARNTQYALLTKTLTCSTLREGLALGQFVYIFAPEFGIPDNSFLITAINQAYVQKVDLTFFVQTDITCVDGEIYTNWSDIFISDV